MDTAVAPAAMLDTAGSGAAEAAARAGVDVVLLEEPWQFERGAALLASIWDAQRESDVVSKEVLRALAHSGNYVAGAFAGGRLVGLSAGFMGLGNGHPHLHSHISGVAADVRHRHIGFALKQHQRAWALRHGFDRVSWTFDPLVRRNAYFNLAKLGAAVTEFHPNFYGPMADGINAGDESDRAVVEWALTSPRAVAAAAGPKQRENDPVGAVILRDRGDGWPDEVEVEFDRAGPRLRAWAPPDIIEVRGRDAKVGLAWRRALRATFGHAIERGYTATNMTRTGWYELER